jgi:hypothetical protein
MTAPVPDWASLALELEAETQVTAELSAAVSVVLELAGGVLLAGSVAALSVTALAALHRRILDALAAVPVDMAPELRDYAGRALELGTRQALRDMPRADRNRRPLFPPAAGLAELHASVAGIDDRARRNLDRAMAVARMPINDDRFLMTAIRREAPGERRSRDDAMGDEPRRQPRHPAHGGGARLQRDLGRGARRLPSLPGVRRGDRGTGRRVPRWPDVRGQAALRRSGTRSPAAPELPVSPEAVRRARGSGGYEHGDRAGP